MKAQTPEWVIVESRRDGSHEFAGTAEHCDQCGWPRWKHVLDGHKPTLSPPVTKEQNLFLRRTNYKVHPGFTKPGSFSTLERAELQAELRRQRQEVERAIANDRAKFKAKARN